MIPFLKPNFDHRELHAALRLRKNSVAIFEKKFAETFQSRYAVAFPWGRSALYALLKVLKIENAEILMPAYSCVVVAHAVVVSGNIPVFVDISPHDFNMKLEDVPQSVTDRTKVLIATNLFGYPVDLDHLSRVTPDDTIVIQDCAMATDTRHKGRLVANEGLAAIYSLNVRKPLSTLGGGVATTNDPELYARLNRFREDHFRAPSLRRQLVKFLFLLQQYAAFRKPVYSAVDFLARKTTLLDKLVVDYHEDRIDVPENFLDRFMDFQARIGLVQLAKLSSALEARRDIFFRYRDSLQDLEGLVLPPEIDGAIYSHYCARIADRDSFRSAMRSANIELGLQFDYVIPEMKAYRKYSNADFPNARRVASEIMNFPNYPGLSLKDQNQIIQAARRCMRSA